MGVRRLPRRMSTLTRSLLAAGTTVLLAASPAAAKRDDHPTAKTKAPAAGAPTTADQYTGKGKGKAPAKVSPSAAAIKDCAADGDLDAVYSPGALTIALRRMPTDLGAYTDCGDVLRFARTAGPSLPASKRSVRLRARCTGAAYEVTVAVGGTTLGTATVPACTRAAKVVRVPLSAPLAKQKGKRRALATVVAKPEGRALQFVARLTGRRH